MFNQEESPASSIYLSSAEKDQIVSNSQKTDPGLTIHGSSTYIGIAEDTAIKMIADIHKAMEVPFNLPPRQTDTNRRVEEVGWEIIYPSDSEKIVSVEVLYQFSYNRKYGAD